MTAFSGDVLNSSLVVLIGSLISAPALAQSDTDGGLDPNLPIPTLQYDRPPPDYSYEFGVQGSYGVITRWRDEVAPWIGFGLRAGWGKNVTESYAHRIGVTALFFAEGPMPVHMTLGFEPHFSWDYVSKKKIQIGAGIGPAVMYHSKITSNNSTQREPGFGASAAVRIGWSQTWSRVGRRLYVVAEPKLRFVDGGFGPLVQLVVGSGKGY